MPDLTATERKRRQRLRDAAGLEIVKLELPTGLPNVLWASGFADAEQLSDPENYARIVAEIVLDAVGAESHAVTNFLKKQGYNKGNQT